MDESEISNVYGWSLPGIMPPAYLAEKTNFVLNWLNILKAGLSVEYTQYSGLFGTALSAISSADITFILGQSDNYENILNQVGRTLKPSGLTWQIVMGSGQAGVELFMRALVEKHILGKGRGFLIVGDNFHAVNNANPPVVEFQSGLLYIIESGLETAKSVDEISALRIVNMMVRIAQSYKSCGVITSTVADLASTWLQEQFKDQNYDALETLAPGFSLFNSQDGQLVKVFDIGRDETVQANTDILYPGNTYTKPQNDNASIEFAYLGGHLNNPIPVDFNAQYIHTGGQIASSEISDLESILPNLNFQSNLVEIGGTVLNSDATQAFLQSAASLGHAYVGGFSYAFATAFQELEESNPEILKPKFYSNVFHSNFTDPIAYPYFNRISIHNVDLMAIFARIMRFFGWQKFTWICEDLPELVDLQEQIAQTRLYGGFEAVITENFDPSVDLNNFDIEYADLIDRIIATNCRIIVGMDYDQESNFKLHETLYKRGYKPGDFIIIYNGQFLDLDGIKEKHPENFEDTMEFFHGALTVTQGKFMGEIGEKLETQYQEILGTDTPVLAGACFEYDAMFTLAYSFDAMLTRGTDYEIPSELNKEIRTQRFTGCSGYLSFERDTNDRNFPAFQLYQTEYKNGSINQILWAKYNPLDIQAVELYRDFFWGDGSSSIPTDTFQEDWDCPFPDDDRQSTPLGETISIAICCFIFGASIVVAIVIWWRFWKVKVLPLEHRVEYSQADLLLTSTIWIEFFQYITTGPDFSPYAYTLSVFANLLAMDIEEVVPLHDGIFWILVNVCIWLTGAMMILYFIHVAKLDIRFGHVQFFRALRRISDNILPILDDILFLPIIQIYLEVFVCIETHGNDRYDMFLQQDCYVNCWTGTHLLYAIVTGICVGFYIPVAIYMRPTWQESEQELNVISDPGYLMVKSVFQIMIVALNKTVGRIQPERFGWIYIIVFVAYFIFLCKDKPFNYNRFCLWKRISILGVIWITLLTEIYLLIEDESQNMTLLIALIIGWFLLVLVGNTIMRKYDQSLYPSKLYFTPSEDIPDMIRFQFRQNSTAEQIRIVLDTHHAIQQYVHQLQARSPSFIHNQVVRHDNKINTQIHRNSVRKPLENMILEFGFQNKEMIEKHRAATSRSSGDELFKSVISNEGTTEVPTTRKGNAHVSTVFSPINEESEPSEARQTFESGDSLIHAVEDTVKSEADEARPIADKDDQIHKIHKVTPDGLFRNLHGREKDEEESKDPNV